MRICAISDLHGNLLPSSCFEEGIDLLLIAGDICPTYDHSTYAQQRFVNVDFKEWLDEFPAKHIVGIAGNHDYLFQKRPDLISKNLRWHLLEDSDVTIEGIKIYGTPWQKVFYDWAFNIEDGAREKKYNLISKDLDILLVHAPPYQILDLTLEGENVGDEILLNRILEVKPKYSIFGHVHESYGTTEAHGLKFINCSLLNRRYQLVNKPTYFNI